MGGRDISNADPKVPIACHYCRTKKSKCSGIHPCTNCLNHEEECWFPQLPNRVKKRGSKEKAIEERFARLEAMLQASLGRHLSPQEVVFTLDDSAPSQQTTTRPLAPSQASREPSKYVPPLKCTTSDAPQTAPNLGADNMTVIHDKPVFQSENLSAVSRQNSLMRSTKYTSNTDYGTDLTPVTQASNEEFAIGVHPGNGLQPGSLHLEFISEGPLYSQPALQPQDSDTLSTLQPIVNQPADTNSISSQIPSSINGRPSLLSSELEPPSKRSRTEAVPAPPPQSMHLLDRQELLFSPDGGGAFGDTASTVDSSHQPVEDSPPNRFLSIFSQSAIDWMAHEIGTTDFISDARKLATDLGRTERLGQTVQAKRIGDPEYDTAVKWSNAYFHEALQSVYGVVNAHSYEARLRNHYDNTAKDDPAWYALRNTIFATGCRIEMSEEDSPSSFSEACSRAWQYFENALSVHTDLVYSQTNIMAVQALLLMAFYSEALGSPALEYMLVSSATRLAQSKGMHLQCRGEPNMGEDTQSMRELLWWSIYAYDKHLAYRSGRPSAIDDDFISCPIPTSVPLGSTMDLDFFQMSIRHAKLNSHIAKQLSTVKAQEQSAEQLLETIGHLVEELEKWRASLPSHLTVKPPFQKLQLPPNISLSHVVNAHFCYWSSMIAIHTSFCYPWSRGWREETSNPEIILQRQQSTKIVAEASRQIIRATQSVHINAASPVWLTFYFPLIGLTNLFIYVIKNPRLPSVPSDISLMEVIVGHFGYLEYASNSELSFPFPRQLTGFARKVYNRSRDSERTPSQYSHNQSVPQSLMKEGSSYEGVGLPLLNPPLTNVASLDFLDGSMEQWPSFLPSFSSITALTMNGDPDIEDFDTYLTHF